ncbi:BZ3500_MvSof-1268-A1-R1_Chr4-2g07056 [Microbotryum saponariae]|uniref:BZ3500_MvSof-1268-A1-R1_Chr4-2g07056 protein n=1 Tax=Microbotryum saponariae TaxID=289078 RepID=A0A2X0LI72_9BASI|nr:BZ3500_MvSof-1268-A1-R1_Chr4-2g07056 [Microbotryum saponariae]SDA06721.1 BZ3501_MvSof-1269-A2-R1_Chr4-2g06767 [Microbotryum saponariae]
MQDDRPTAATANDQQENEEDALPDWRQFATFANKFTAQDDYSHVSAVPFIPKRGEKDFEPVPPSSSLPASSDLATLSSHQISQLNESRAALFSALSTGSRHHSSKAYNSFTWDPQLARAALDRDQSFGVHLGSMGRHSSERKRLELLPEEALYLVERGAIELWTKATGTKQDERGPRVPMSVQQAWAELVGADELTIERYQVRRLPIPFAASPTDQIGVSPQVYANLRRLGFILHRTRAPAPKPRSTSRPTLAPTPPRSFSPRTVIQWIAWPLIRFRELVVHFGRWCFPTPLAPHLRLTVSRVLKPMQGRMKSLVSGHRWTTYEQIFSCLRIVPTGHDTPLPRRALPRAPSRLTPLDPLPPTDPSPNPSSSLPPLSTHPYQPFFNVYKPITKYRKTDPPPPDFQLVVINASTTSMPDLFELFDMFEQVPLSTTEDLLAPPPRVVRHNLAPKSTRPPRKTFTPRSADSTSSTKSWRSYLPWSPKRRTAFEPSAIQKMSKKGSSIYPRLKVGRRSILIAVVDNGTISMMRFSENEFGKLPWIGLGRKA